MIHMPYKQAHLSVNKQSKGNLFDSSVFLMINSALASAVSGRENMSDGIMV